MSAAQRKRPAWSAPGAEINNGDGAKNSTARNMLPPGSKFCQCSGCREYFTAVSSFDKHGVGKYEVRTGPERRRCLTVFEMQHKGWRITDGGYWTDRPAMLGAVEFARPARVGDAISEKTYQRRASHLRRRRVASA